MSQLTNGIFAALAVSATLGAAQLASGHDLSDLTGRRQVASAVGEAGINRAAKADRAAIKVAPGEARTVAFRPDSITGTSVLVRIPVAKEEVRNRPVAPMKSGKSKNAVACEPPVSVLTDVAKLLEPGRCVT